MSHSNTAKFRHNAWRISLPCYFAALMTMAFSAQARGDHGYSGYGRPYQDPYVERRQAYRDDAFGRYKYPRGRPIPGDGLNRNNRPGNGLNYGYGGRQAEPYPDFRQQNQRRRFSDNSGPRQRDYQQHDRHSDFHRYNQRRGFSDNSGPRQREFRQPERRDSRRDYWRNGNGYHHGERFNDSRGRHDYQSRNYRDQGQKYYRRPSGNNYYQPRINR